MLILEKRCLDGGLAGGRGGVEGAERSLIARIMGEKLCKITCNKVIFLDAETEIVK
jgi:hypothetical protein